MDIEQLLHYLNQFSSIQLWLFFLVENLLIILLVILIGEFVRNRKQVFSSILKYNQKEWLFSIITVILNTAITYLGYWLYKHAYITINLKSSWMILVDFIILFMAMDFLMYVFHIVIHNTFLYKMVHSLHHQSIHPKPIDLFILHPIETIGFGLLWLFLLITLQFNIFAIGIYLTVNVLLGMIGHLGMEPIPKKLLNSSGLKYLGSSTFHHNHHEHVNSNFGFYTSIWDRLFGTYYK